MMQRSLAPCLPDSLTFTSGKNWGPAAQPGCWDGCSQGTGMPLTRPLRPSSENVTGSHLIPGADFCWTQNSGLIVLSSRTWKLYHFWLHHTDKFSRLRITSLAGEGWSLSLMSSTLVFGSWLRCDLTLDYLFRTFSTSWTCMLHILPNSVQLLFLLVVSTCAYSYFLHNFNNITLISYPTGPWGFTYTFHSVFALLPPS